MRIGSDRMSVLLTGGTGFVGINIAEKLMNEKLEVVVYALNPLLREAERVFADYKNKFHFIQGDILDSDLLEETIEKYNVTSIIHAAAVTPDASRETKNGEAIIKINVMGTITVLELARKYKIEKMIYLSSVSAYGNAAYEGDILIEDSSASKPNTLYEISKFTAERIAIRYRQLFGMNIAATRIGEVFGAWEYDTGMRDTLSAPYQAVKLAVSGGKALLPREGKKTWVYAKDIADAIYALLETGTFKHDMYHVSSTFTWSLKEWCELLAARYPGFTYEILREDQEEIEANINFYHHIDQSPLQINRLVEETSFSPSYDLKRSFEDYMEWVDKYGIYFH
ncbi:NAD-dependent epimerase/dehydratase family protein [Paenibacillus sp. sgz302251]|uniref:NAD-dependent epimerase/dehydratase family protein n=1 Tax=Paenibacillus sp. sgz302251 TaxID=3414493 RepID=UPI003C7BA98E